MSLIIQYIASVDEATGNIRHLELTGKGLPSEGRIPNSEPPQILIHLKSSDKEGWAGYSSTQILEQFWWSGEEWKHRGPRPGDFYSWNFTDKTWDFDREAFLKILRDERDCRLFKCDWTQAADSPLNDLQKEEWKIYRQALRDIPSAFGDVDTLQQVGWPNPPDGSNIEFTMVL